MKGEAQLVLSVDGQQALNYHAPALKQVEDLSAVTVRTYLIHQIAQIMSYDSLHTTMLYIRGARQNLQRDMEKIAWI